MNGVMVSAYNMAFAAGALAAVSPDAGLREAGDTCSQAEPFFDFRCRGRSSTG
jgi:hypothetical protein